MTLPSPWQNLGPADWRALAQEHGTPFYLFDADDIADRIRAVRDAFQGLAQVYYAVKANPNLHVLRALCPVTDGVDISSGGEQQQATLAGYEPARMSYAGPAKTEAELEAAILAGVGCISVESLREIDACGYIARRLGIPAQILLRVNPQLANRTYGLKMGGRASQFGIDEEVLPTAETLILGHGPHIVLRGLHTYIGSQCFDPTGIVEATRNALRIAAEIEQRTGIALSKVNLGGGFGIASTEARKELDLAALARELVPTLESFRNKYPACQPLFELGRYLTTHAGIYVTSVISSKVSRGKTFVMCDGGLNHHLAAAGTFGAALRGNFPLRNLSRPDSELRTCSVAGPSCNPTDLLGIDVEVAEAEEGDLLGVLMSGSYGLTASPVLFLGRASPVELVRNGALITVGRRRHSITDFN